LLGMMLAAGAFAGLVFRPVSALLYVQLGGRVDAHEQVALKGGADLIAPARADLEAMIASYADPAMPYLVVPQPQFVPRYDDYQHLGRINEWGLAVEDDAEAGDAA